MKAPEPGGAVARIQSLLPTLEPGERRVAEVFLARPDRAIEASSQEIGTAAGVSRATVVRTCRRLGFTSYPQLRVLLARDLGMDRATGPGTDSAPGSCASSTAPWPTRSTS